MNWVQSTTTTATRRRRRRRQGGVPFLGRGNAYRSSSIGVWFQSLPNVIRALIGLAVVQWAILSLLSSLLWPTDTGHNQPTATLVAQTNDDDNDDAINTTEPPLDNYMDRRRAAPDNHNNNNNTSHNLLPLLIVGGSDGSGTRAVVELLGRLGVPMVLDDVGTGDVHATSVVDGDGWPALVRLVLQATQSANYEWETDLTYTQQVILQSAVQEGIQQPYEARGQTLRRQGEKQGMALAKGVAYGFKAPVSMLLLPVLEHVFSSRGIFFLHVLRDGRDVALSNNTSPVHKFYRVFYPNATRRKQVLGNQLNGSASLKTTMAMQLWNDWNLQVHEWAHRRLARPTNSGFDYMVLRTEDLMHPSTRFTMIRQLADIVGSSQPMAQLCCLSHETIQDLGQSGIGPPTTTLARPMPPPPPPSPSWWEQLSLWLKHEFGVSPFSKSSFGQGAVGGASRAVPPEFAAARRQQQRQEQQERQAHSNHKDGEAVELPDVWGIQQEADQFSQRLSGTRPDLFGQLQHQRDLIRHHHHLGRQRQLALQQHQALLEEDASADPPPGNTAAVKEEGYWEDKEEEQPRHKENEEDEERFPHGSAQRKPWHNAHKPPPPIVVVDHVKYDTMLERIPQTQPQRPHQPLSWRHHPEQQQQQQLQPRDRLRRHHPNRRVVVERESPEQVRKRYGKWRHALKDQPQLLQVLQQEGAQALARFGYEPRRRFSDFPPNNDCHSPPVQCHPVEA